MCTFSQSVVLARLLSSLQFYRSTRRRFSVKNIVRDSAGSKSGCRSTPPVATSTHVPSRAMCRAPPVPSVICFCTRFTASTVSPQDQSHGATRRLPQRSRIKRRPNTPSLRLHTRITMPFVVHATDEAEPTEPSARCECTSCHNSCFTSTHLSEMMAATTPFLSSTVTASSQRTTNQVNAHQRHTRAVQSSSCAEVSFLSSPISCTA